MDDLLQITLLSLAVSGVATSIAASGISTLCSTAIPWARASIPAASLRTR